MIAAVAANGVIGAGGEIPWRISADLKRFKAITMGKPVIMGRRTFESIGKPLPGRHNIVVTGNKDYRAAGCTVVHSLEEALAAAGDAEEVMVIGGTYLYRAFLPQAGRLYLTLLEASVAGDTYFPPINKEAWQEVWREEHAADEKNPHAYSFVIWERRNEKEGC